MPPAQEPVFYGASPVAILALQKVPFPVLPGSMDKQSLGHVITVGVIDNYLSVVI